MVLLGYLGPFNTINEECALKNVNYSCPLTVRTVEKSLIMSTTASGEWLKLNLEYHPTIFATITNEELVKRYKISKQKEKFRSFQERYIKDWNREKIQERKVRESLGQLRF
jgi:hypothetical protein